MTASGASVWKSKTDSRRRGIREGSQTVFQMKYAFHPEAEAEFHHSIDYYEHCEKIGTPLTY
jgi:hypothetical protein